MKKFRLLGVALCALLALGALTAAPASAATFLLAEWLVNGTAVGIELSVEASGELTLKDSGLSGGSVLCSMIFYGWVAPNSLGYVSEVLTLDGGLTSNPLGSVPLLCTGQERCEAILTPEVWAVNIPWEMESELMEDSGTFFAILTTSPSSAKTVGWAVECTILGVRSEDTCTAAETVSEVNLEGANLIVSFSPAFTVLAGAKLANCTMGGMERGEITGETRYTMIGGGELTPSSEGVVG
jgi:hypothetical protein